MFGQLGQLASLMKNLPKIREEVEKLQGAIGRVTAEGDAGAGMVKAKVNGHMEILRCEISEELMKLNDREMLEDLVRAAVNQAIKKAKQAVQEETGKMASGLGLPPGANLPGLSMEN
jgi:DNA-binding YbaB/EbfC family protein